ncbi:hypothetical protein JXI42_13090, partial [bacterium]|nr:hypothetical protein [bacterium]
PIPLDFDQPYWMELKVEGEILIPRQPLTSVPYSIHSSHAVESDTANALNWSNIYGVPAGFADNIDDTGHFEPNTIDTFIAHWDSIRFIPLGFLDEVDNYMSGEAAGGDLSGFYPDPFVDYADSAGAVTWENVANKPSTLDSNRFIWNQSIAAQPGADFWIDGDGKISGGNLIVDSPTYPSRTFEIRCGGRQEVYTANDYVTYCSGNIEFRVGTALGTNQDLYITSGSGVKFFAAEGDEQEVGIGTINPGNKLEVNGEASYTSVGNMGTDDADFASKKYVDDNVITYFAGNDLYLEGDTFNLENNIDVDTVIANGPQGLSLFEDGGNGIFIEDGGFVGIGTTTPNSKLSISGTGSPEYGVFIEGPSTSVDDQAALRIHSNKFSSSPGSYTNYYGIFVDQEQPGNAFLKPRAIVGQMTNVTDGYCTGVFGIVNGTGSAGGRAYGIRGQAGSCTSGYNYAVYGQLTGTRNGTCVLGTLTGDVVIPGQYAGYFSGPVYVSGALTKAGGGFKIDHPEDPANKYLVHSFVESPDMKNVYDGIVELDEKGEAWVQLPDYFETLNRDFRYQLTCIGKFASVYVAEEIENNMFKISGGAPGMKVSWQVTGIRIDPWANQNRIIPVEEKEEKGVYLNPELYTSE